MEEAAANLRRAISEFVQLTFVAPLRRLVERLEVLLGGE